jgi:hypothetical protein
MVHGKAIAKGKYHLHEARYEIHTITITITMIHWKWLTNCCLRIKYSCTIQSIYNKSNIHFIYDLYGLKMQQKCQNNCRTLQSDQQTNDRVDIASEDIELWMKMIELDGSQRWSACECMRLYCVLFVTSPLLAAMSALLIERCDRRVAGPVALWCNTESVWCNVMWRKKHVKCKECID